jgi:hypothetical protein
MEAMKNETNASYVKGNGQGKEIMQNQSTASALLDLLPVKRENSFIMKLYNMLNLNEYPEIVRWNKDGTFFTIENRQEFISTVLKKCFGGVKMSSFLRQLNMYSFTKDPQGIKYTHPYFTKANPVLLKLIKRRQFPASQKIDFPPIDYESGGKGSVADDVATDLDSAFVSVKAEPFTPEEMSAVAGEDAETSSNAVFDRPVVSPHYPQSRAQLPSQGVCRRCAQVEHLFHQEDPFKGVFEEDNEAEAVPEHEQPLFNAESGLAEEQSIFATSATSAFSAFKADDSKYFDAKDDDDELLYPPSDK